MNEIKMTFKGLNSSETLKESMEQLLMPLKYLIPPASSIRLNLSRYSKNFEASLIIRSPLGDFMAEENGKDLVSLAKRARGAVKQQILKSRQTRQAWRKVG